jgi:hypothetical protein
MDVGRLLIILGIALLVGGFLMTVAPKIPLVGKLPGDILIKRDGFTFYFPLATSIVVSIILSLILRFFNR